MGFATDPLGSVRVSLRIIGRSRGLCDGPKMQGRRYYRPSKAKPRPISGRSSVVHNILVVQIFEDPYKT